VENRAVSRPLQHLLAGDGDGQDAALPGTPGLMGEACRLPGEAPEKDVLHNIEINS